MADKSMVEHAKLENLKRMAREILVEAELPVEELDEIDMELLIQYFDDVCKDLNSLEDIDTKLHYLLKLIIVNSAVVVMKMKEVKALKGE